MMTSPSSPCIGLATPKNVSVTPTTPLYGRAAGAPPSPAQRGTPQAARLTATTAIDSPSPLAPLPSPRHPLRSYATEPMRASFATPNLLAPPMVRVPATPPRLRSPVRLDVDLAHTPPWPTHPHAFQPNFWPSPPPAPSPSPSPATGLASRIAAMTHGSPRGMRTAETDSPFWAAYTPELAAAGQQAGRGRLVRHPAVLAAVAREESRALLGYVNDWVGAYEDFWPKRHDAVALRDRLVGTAGLLDELRQALDNRRRAQLVLRPTAGVLRQAQVEAARVPTFGSLSGWVARTHVPIAANPVGLGLFGVPNLPSTDHPLRCYANADDHDVVLEGKLHQLQYATERWLGCEVEDREFYANYLVQLQHNVVKLHEELAEYLAEHPL